MGFSIYDVVGKETLDNCIKLTNTLLSMYESISQLPEGEYRRQMECQLHKILFFLIDGNLYDNDAKRMHGWEMIEEKYYKNKEEKL
nr:MAG TPA: hypothetical protein [Bacteriophage sp.]